MDDNNWEMDEEWEGVVWEDDIPVQAESEEIDLTVW